MRVLPKNCECSTQGQGHKMWPGGASRPRPGHDDEEYHHLPTGSDSICQKEIKHNSTKITLLESSQVSEDINETKFTSPQTEADLSVI